jgi:hypothetical protein
MGARVVHPGRPIESAVLRCQKPALLGLLRLSAWHLLATVECLAKIPERCHQPKQWHDRKMPAGEPSTSLLINT